MIKTDYFEGLEKEINYGLTQDQIPMGFDRLNHHVGLRKATYYLIGGFTGSGKSSFLDDAFILNRQLQLQDISWYQRQTHYLQSLFPFSFR
jgi:ABC-type lipoprotein export system ATPase subunit